MKKTEDIWTKSPLNSLAFDGQNYKGTLYYNGVEFSATLNYQTSGKYVLRGRISVISPVSGRIMVARMQDSDAKAGTVGKRVSAEIYANKNDEASVKAAILNGAAKLFQKNALTISRELQITSRPDTITPSVAAYLYADTYIAKIRSGLKMSSAEKYAEEIKRFYSRLPSKPMAQIKAKEIQNELMLQNVGIDKAKRLYEFWAFLLDCGHTSGINPFPPPQKRKISAKAKQMNLDRIDELSLAQQDKLYEQIIKKKIIHGGDCGVALIVWGGFNIGDKKTWGDLDIRDAENGFSVMNHHRNDLAGATHTFDRPLFPQAAEILYQSKKRLLEKYSEKQLCNMPIVSTLNDPTKPMKSQSLNQYAGKLLREIGIPEAVFSKMRDSRISAAKQILFNTYCKNLYTRIGLTWDDGALQYLQGLSLSGNVTNDNYTSYSDEEAALRLFTAMKSIQPEKALNTNDRIIEDSEIGKRIIISPQKKRERVGAVGTIILPPGMEVSIICPHGVTGELRAREMLPDGKKKKAARKKKQQ